MAEIVRMPKMSDTMTEGVVAKWHKKVGDTVKTGDLVAEIETDKATMEFESYQSGTLLYIGVEEGKAVPVDGILAILGKPGEDYKPLLKQEEGKKPVEKAQSKSEEKRSEAKAGTSKEEKPQPEKQTGTETQAAPEPPKIKTPAASFVQDDRIKASPLARKLAEEKGIDLSRLKGTGNGGRVTKRDIDWFKPGMFVASGGVAAVMKESYEDIPVSQMRKTIAKRLAESKYTAPHFYLTMEINMDMAHEARESINLVTDSKISFNDLILKAAAVALRQHPKVNASWRGDKIRINHHIHIGVAVAVDEGLLVPVVRFADSKTLTQINSEVKIFSQKAKDKKLQPLDWEGNTFTISNLGMFGIDEFTAIINTPDSCILAVGAIKQVPIVRNGKLRIANMMKVTLSCDHRAVDGVTGSKFLQTLKGLLENPVILMGEGAI